MTKKDKIKFLTEQNEFLKIKELEAVNLKIEKEALIQEIETLNMMLCNQDAVIEYLENRNV